MISIRKQKVFISQKGKISESMFMTFFYLCGQYIEYDTKVWPPISRTPCIRYVCVNIYMYIIDFHFFRFLRRNHLRVIHANAFMHLANLRIL